MNSDWRPPEGGHIALSDDGLARIGYAAVTEALAKSTAAAALRALERLTEQQWISLERVQFKQITERIKQASEGLDEELTRRVSELMQAREREQQLRHIVVHAVWAEGADADGQPDVIGYDYGRERLITAKEIEEAVAGCAALRLAASSVAMRIAELIEQGIIPERTAGRGVSIRTRNRLVRL